jgi:hypothetical protein
MIRRKRRIRIALSDLWDGIDPRRWDIFAPKPDPDVSREGYRRWAENKARVRHFEAERAAAQSDHASPPARGQPSSDVPLPSPAE